MRYYKNQTYWKKFTKYFPEDFRIKEGNEPAESYWKYKDFSIHLDRYLPENNDKKIKIVLVHGGGGNGRLLSPMGVGLSTAGYECVAADLPGFGLTEYGKSVGYDDWVDIIEALVTQEDSDARQIVLVGISLGGMLAYQVACLNASVKGLVVTSLADLRLKEVRVQLSKIPIMGKLGDKLLSATSPLSDKIKVPIRIMTKMWAMANDSSFVKLLEKDKVGSGSWVYLKFFRTLFDYSPHKEPEEFNQCSVLWLQPEKDYIIPYETTAHFYDMLKTKKEVVILKNCGHIPMEDPGIYQFKEEVERYLETLER